jgi:hypothetical protein
MQLKGLTLGKNSLAPVPVSTPISVPVPVSVSNKIKLTIVDINNAKHEATLPKEMTFLEMKSYIHQ